MIKTFTTTIFLFCLYLNCLAQSVQTHGWDFDGPVVSNKVDGWNIYRYTGANTSNGILNLVVANTYCNINYNVPAGTLDPNVTTQAIIRLKNNSGDKRARFYWSTTTVSNAYIEFQLSLNDADFKEYTIDLSNDPRWTGVITNIRFEAPYFPNPYGNTLNIDYVKLTTTPPLPVMPPIKPSPFGVNLAGAEFGEIGTNHYGYPTIGELDYFKSKGLTLFRLPFKWERIQPELNGPLNQTELAMMRNFVGAARARGLWVLLDMHNYGRRKIGSTTYIIGAPELSIAHVADGWKKLAAEFKDFGNIWGYGIMNEPHGQLASTPWVTIAQGIINGIRTVDTQNSIVVGGDSFSSAARWLTASDNLKTLTDPSNNLIFEAHIYLDDQASGLHDETYDGEGTTPTTGVNRAAPFVSWLKTNNKQGFIGEYGVPDNDPRWLVALENMLIYLKENAINGTYWAAGPRWGTYTLSVEPRDGQDRPQMATLVKFPYADSVVLPPPPPPTDGKHSYWNFDEASGTTVTDSWNARVATLSSGVSHAAGKFNNGLKFNGSSNAYASLPAGILSSVNDFTVSSWVKTDDAINWVRLFDFGSSTASYMMLTLRNSETKTVRYSIKDNNGMEQRINTSAILPTGVWTHIAITQYGNTGIIYVNGVEVGRNNGLTLKPSDLGTTTQNWLGRSQFADPKLKGTIDNFKIFSKALTPSEITIEFEPTPPAPESGEHSYWTFNEASGTTATDSWNGRIATLDVGASHTSGKYNNGLKLNGSANAFATLPNGIVSSLDDFTIASWVKLDNLSNWARLFDFGSSTTSNMYVTPRNGSTKVRYSIRHAGIAQEISSSKTLPVGVWSHIAVTQSGNTGILYVDGVEVGRNNNLTLRPSSLGSTTQNWLGRSQFPNDPKLNGVIDDFKIFSKALSASEVSSLFKLGQSITFNAVSPKTIGDPDFALSAVASSGLPVSYTSSDTSVARVVNDMVQVVGAGTTTLTATQVGNDAYLPAEPVSHQFIVNKKEQIIVFGPISEKVLGEPDFSISASISSGLPIIFSSSDMAIATVENGIVKLVGVGSTIISASQEGNEVYAAVTPVNQILVVKQDTIAPTVPASLTASATDSTVTLSWASSIDFIGVTGYRIYKDGVLLNTVQDTLYIVNGLQSSVTYSFKIVATDKAGNLSVPASISIITPDTQAPDVPLNLTANKTNHHKVALSWEASTDNVGVTGYHIFRNGVQISTQAITNISYLAERPIGKDVYVFTVKAIDEAGNISEASNSAISANGNIKENDMMTINSLPDFRTTPLAAKSEGIIAYPNPSQGTFRISVNTIEKGAISIMIFSPSGMLIQSFKDLKNEEYQKEISLNRLVPGVYYIKVRVGSFSQAKSLIIN